MSAFHDNALMGASGSQGYQISRSVRLRSSASAYFNRTPASAGNRKTWTFSFWHKRGAIADCIVFGSRNAGTTTVGYIGFQSDKFDFQFGATGNRIQDVAVRRDPSAWAHFHVVCDTTNATSTERMQLWVNGVRVTSFSQTSYPTQNADSDFNVADFHAIGRYGASASNYVDGYLTEINFIDGQALTPTSFGQFNSVTGVWQPLKYTGTYGTNGFYLNFSDNSNNTATTIGKDYSGNGNNWTPNNISVTSGSTYDSMLDVPTPYADGGNGRGNYAVLNPLFAAGTVSDGNLKHTASTTTWVNTSSTIFVSSGKWYFEATNIAGNYTMIGVATNSASTSQNYGTATDTWTYFNDGTKYGNGATATAYGASYTTGNVIGVALDMDAGTLTFYKDGVSQGTAFSTGLAGLSLCPWFGSYTSGNGVNVNFGQRPFAYTPPTGFKALNTQNLPAPTISNGALYMAATTYTGNGANRSISNAVNGVSFQPDFVWIKGRSQATSNALYDAVRGATKVLVSNTTGAEVTVSDSLTSFNSNGFSLGIDTNAFVNANGATYVGWQWQAGAGTTSSNTSGSITSTVSVNATAGFSVVTFTSPSSGTFTVGHGLGVAPKMVIIKDRGQIGSWSVYHASATTNSQYLLLNSTAAVGSSTNYFGTAIPSSTVFGANAGVSVQTSDTCVAYCFSAVTGYSAFGSYTGNGSTDGPFVYFGFRPRFVMVKRTDAVGNWITWDSARNAYNATDAILYPNLSNAEGTGVPLDFLSNGFKMRDTSTSDNASGGTYIFAAFAENPFKLSLAR